ncbi:hypothetical protein [Agromyces sp. NBRC 114283]
MHRTYAGSLELDERNPSLRASTKLAEAFQVDPLDLIRNSTD